MQPLTSSSRNNSGTAVISLEASATLYCPSVKRFSRAQALTTAKAGCPRSRACERRAVLPSIATTSPSVNCATRATQLRKQRAKARGSSRASTRPKVSCEGMPCGKAKKVCNHACRAWPKVAIAVTSFAPQMTASLAIVMMSSNKWSHSAGRRRGSGKSAKCASKLATGAAFSAAGVFGVIISPYANTLARTCKVILCFHLPWGVI